MLQGKDFKINELTGLAPDQPFGLAVVADGNALVPLVLLPTTDPDKLLEQIKTILRMEP